jgi:hypothetical protein
LSKTNSVPKTSTKTKSQRRSAKPAAKAAPAGKTPAPKRPRTPAGDSAIAAPRAAGGGGLSAAYQVLLAAKAPMRVKDLSKAVIDKGLWAPGGKTPWATLASALGREIKHGDEVRFKKTGRGLFEALSTR